MEHTKVPELRFRQENGTEFSALHEIRLGEITKQESIKNKKDEGYPVYSINNIDGFVKQDELFEDSRYATLDKTAYMIVKNGRFAYNPARINVGSIAYQDKEPIAIVSSLYEVFYGSENLCSQWLKQYFLTHAFQKGIFKYGEGGVRVYLFYENFSQIKVQLPSISEQQKIANFLMSIDHRVALADKKLSALQTIKKGMLQKIFSQELRFKDDNGKGFPTWEKKSIGDVCKIIRGLSYNKENVSQEQNDTIVLRSNNIGDSYVVNYSHDLQFVNIRPNDNQLLKKNDIVICMANGSSDLVGKTAVYDGKSQNPKITVGAFCAIIRTQYPIVQYLFETSIYQKELRRLKQGGNGAIGNLNPSKIKEISFFFPSIPEQNKIASYLISIDYAIAATQKKADALRTIKKGLLQKMFV